MAHAPSPHLVDPTPRPQLSLLDSPLPHRRIPARFTTKTPSTAVITTALPEAPEFGGFRQGRHYISHES